jgi:hypothetical protein
MLLVQRAAHGLVLESAFGQTLHEQILTWMVNLTRVVLEVLECVVNARQIRILARRKPLQLAGEEIEEPGEALMISVQVLEQRVHGGIIC